MRSETYVTDLSVYLDFYQFQYENSVIQLNNQQTQVVNWKLQMPRSQNQYYVSNICGKGSGTTDIVVTRFQNDVGETSVQNESSNCGMVYDIFNKSDDVKIETRKFESLTYSYTMSPTKTSTIPLTPP